MAFRQPIRDTSKMPLALTSSHTFPAVSVAAVLVFILLRLTILSPKARLRAHLARLPILNGSASGEEKRKAFLETAHQLYQAGYQKFKDEAYRMPTSDDVENVVIPPKFMRDLRTLPDSDLNFYPAAEKILESKYTGVLTDLSSVAYSVRAELTPALARLNPIVYDEVDHALKHDMPECTEWTPVPMYMTIAHMVAKITGRVFVGEGLCRSPEYLDNAINYAVDVHTAQVEVKRMSPLLRPFLAPRLASVRRLRRREAAAARFFEPLVQSRLDAERSGDPDWRAPDDMLSVLMRKSEGRGIVSAAEMAKIQLGIIFASVHTTSDMYDLAVRPEYMAPLREEIRGVLAAHGGEMTARGLQQMLKLDSFMKESLRLSPPLTTTFHRVVGRRGLALPNGQHVPPGATVELASRAIVSDPAWHQGDADPAVFDGLRHYRRRTRPGAGAADHARHQFVASHEQSLAFGYGRHACPGRFFAANELKMLLARLILEFDFKNADGSTERYPNIEIGPLIAPDEHKDLLFKRVKT
ncbi:cytochrome P450 monooxygenase [Diplogelasinospora grovesii]|uniref:Cytochrome P450 monooxygenase n=1 Tax=Diplogelasinospora grovesii TaxID=303347 RepID=A0AAN6S0S9_9PEZI|nr:cytochrome P450 monooxygenase [Diplogelasinospora grovesii]